MNEKDIERICKIYKYKFPNRSLDFYRVGLAQEILRILVSNEWTNQAVFEQHPIKPKKTEEARNYLKSQEGGFQWQERVFRLADRIYNLQNVGGISGIIKGIKNGGLTSRYAELDAASHLYRRNIQFDFVIPRGIKEHDFDIKIKDEIEINCEVKHKIESTKLTEKTLLDTLESAKTQVPAIEPDLFFVKIPETWMKDLQVTNVVDTVLDSFFKSGNKILGIVFSWEARHLFNEGMFLWRYSCVKNEYYSGPKCDVLLSKLQSNGINWVGLEELVKKYI